MTFRRSFPVVWIGFILLTACVSGTQAPPMEIAPTVTPTTPPAVILPTVTPTPEPTLDPYASY